MLDVSITIGMWLMYHVAVGTGMSHFEAGFPTEMVLVCASLLGNYSLYFIIVIPWSLHDIQAPVMRSYSDPPNFLSPESPFDSNLLYKQQTTTITDSRMTGLHRKGTVHQNGLSLISAYINNHIHYKVWGEITDFQTSKVQRMTFGNR